jgi:hypothetical protein
MVEYLAMIKRKIKHHVVQNRQYYFDIYRAYTKEWCGFNALFF